MTGATAAPPREWPKEFVDEYQPIRVLGKGGFAAVMLAKSKTTKKHYAIKVVDNTDVRYGHREIDILQALPQHCNIMKLHRAYESTSPIVMALEYCRGPTLNAILVSLGAPSLVFCRVVAAQLVDAVAHLHSHAVLHRDIKPNNLLIANYDPKDPNVLQTDDEVTETDSVDWKALCKKWHLSLVDFGFARALQPEDLKNATSFNPMQSLSSSRHLTSSPSASKSKKNIQDPATSLNDPIEQNQSTPLDKSSHSLGSSGGSSKGLRRKSSLFRRKGSSNDFAGVLGISRHMVRSMSALGHRDYAAPEILKNVRQEKSHPNSLSEFVSDFGMVADAYSVGCTIRYLLTGVSPDLKVEAAIAEQRAPAARLGRWMDRKLNKGAPKRQKRRIRSVLPPEVVRMVKGMTQGDPKQRTTVRAARLYPWIDDILEEQSSGTRPFHQETTFLKIKSKAKDPKEVVDPATD